MQRWVTRLVLVVVGFLLCACSLPNPFGPDAAVTPEIPRGGVISIALADRLEVSQPWHVTNRAAEVLTTLTQSGLTRLDASGAPQLELLERWQANPTGTVITATLKPDLRWSDDQPLTTADVVYTYTTLQSIRPTTPLLHELAVVSAIRAIDAQQVVFTLAAPYPSLLTLWALPILPAHVLQAQPIESLNLLSLATGAGPFVFAERDAEGAVHLRANPSYVRGAPFVDGVVLIHHDDAAQVGAGIQTGTITIAEFSTAVQPMPTGSRSARVPENELTALVYNTRPQQRFAEQPVRAALRDVLLRDSGLESPAGTMTVSVLPLPGHPFAPLASAAPVTATVTATAVVSPTIALQQALETSGWQWDAASARFVVDGTPVAVRIGIAADHVVQQALAKQIAARWNAAGIPTEVVTLQREQYLEQFIPPFAFDVALVSWGNSRTDTGYADTYLYDGSQAALFSRDGMNSGMPDIRPTTNLSGYRSPAYDRLIAAVPVNPDGAARSAAERAALSQIQADVPVLPLVRPYRTVVWTDRLRSADGAQTLDSPWYLWGVERWYLAP